MSLNVSSAALPNTPPQTGSPAILRTEKATIRFGGLVAVSELDMSVQQGEIYGLIGPNGAGKTTIFNLLTGVYEPTSGEIYFEDKRIDGQRPYQIASHGISRTFQNIRLFPSMSVLDNVLTACHMHKSQNLLDAVLRTPRYQRCEDAQYDYCMELLAIFELDGFKDEGGTSLPYGKQRRLEIVRALATRPKLLLLDEPAAGMNASETENLKALLQTIRSSGITILLIEHDVKLIMGLCDRIAVLDYGRKIAEGVPEEVRNNPAVISAYIGGGVS